VKAEAEANLLAEEEERRKVEEEAKRRAQEEAKRQKIAVTETPRPKDEAGRQRIKSLIIISSIAFAVIIIVIVVAIRPTTLQKEATQGPEIVDSEKAQMVLGHGPSILSPKEQESAIIVSKDGSGNFRTIREAMDSAESGKLIIIKDGTYYEDRLKFPKSGIKIRGESRQNTVIVGTSGDPVFIPSDHSRIENMTVINEKYEIPYYKKTVVWISGVEDVEIRNNIFRGGGTGITVSNRDTIRTNVVISSNIIEKFYYAGVYIENANVDISYNILVNGIDSKGAFVFTQTSNGHIRNNTVVNTGNGLYSGDKEKMGLRVYNNIIMNNKIGFYVPQFQMDIKKNILWNNGNTFWDWTSGGYPGRKYEEEGNIIVDPKLRNVGKGDYSLSEGSPAIGNGIGGVDIGAVQYKRTKM